MHFPKNPLKVQSALEYMVTYSWAIVLVAIAIVAFWQLGVFGTGVSQPVGCIGEAGFSCSSPYLTSSGLLVTLLSTSLNNKVVVTGTACTNSTQQPTAFAQAFTVLNQYQPKSFDFWCPLTSTELGSTFSGTLWIRYNEGTQTGLVLQVATVVITVQRIFPLFAVAADFGGGGPATATFINLQNDTVSNTLSLGSACVAAALNPTQTTAFITCEATNNVWVVNTTTYNVVNVIPVGSEPYGIAMTPYGVYVGYGSQVGIIDPNTYEVVNVIGVGPNLYGIAVSQDGSTVYVAGESSDVLYIISTTTNSVVGTVAVGSQPHGVAITPSNNQVFVANKGDGTITAYNTGAQTTSTFSVGGAPWGITMSPNGDTLYVANEKSGTVQAVNVLTQTVTATASVGGNPIDVAVTPDGRKLIVTGAPNAYAVSIINAQSMTVTNTISVLPGGGPNGVVVSGLSVSSSI